MPKVIQMSHMILRRLSVQECEQFLLIFFAINTFLSPNHIMSKNLYNATAFPQLGLPLRVMWIDSPSKLKRCISKTFFRVKLYLGSTVHIKLRLKRKKLFENTHANAFIFLVYVSSLCACLRVHPIKCLLVVIATLFSLQLRSWGFRERSMIFTSKSGHIFNWLLKRNDFRNNWTRNIVILIYSAFHSNPFLQVSKTIIMSSFTDC